MKWHCLRCNARTDRSPTDRALCVACVDKLAADQRKRCRGCNRFCSLTLFGVDRHTKDGLTTRCRSCRTHASADWRRQNSERARLVRRRHRQERPEQYRGYDRARRERDGERRLKQHRESYARNQEKRNEADRERYERERDRRLAWQNDYYQRNKERITREKRERYQARKVALLREMRGER